MTAWSIQNPELLDLDELMNNDENHTKCPLRKKNDATVMMNTNNTKNNNTTMNIDTVIADLADRVWNDYTTKNTLNYYINSNHLLFFSIFFFVFE